MRVLGGGKSILRNQITERVRLSNGERKTQGRPRIDEELKALVVRLAWGNRL